MRSIALVMGRGMLYFGPVDKTLRQLLFTLVRGWNDKIRMVLLQHFGSLEAIEAAAAAERLALKGYSADHEKAWQERTHQLPAAQAEWDWMQAHHIHSIFWGEEGYPPLLQHTADGPALLFSLGQNLGAFPRSVAIIGTRNNSAYGKRETEKLVAALPKDVVVVSGLALGIDQVAHEAALAAGLKTIAVLGHGLDRVYPHSNRALAKKIIQQGALWTDFVKGTPPHEYHFPKRNRIVAGMCPVTVVMESGEGGGSLITANLAFGYGRSLYALPGRTYDEKSMGTNHLLHSQKAQVYLGPEAFLQEMGWAENATTQAQLCFGPSAATSAFSPLAQQVFQVLLHHEKIHIDALAQATGLGFSQLAGALLELDLEACLQSLPGQCYALQQP